MAVKHASTPTIAWLAVGLAVAIWSLPETNYAQPPHHPGNNARPAIRPGGVQAPSGHVGGVPHTPPQQFNQQHVGGQQFGQQHLGGQQFHLPNNNQQQMQQFRGPGGSPFGAGQQPGVPQNFQHNLGTPIHGIGNAHPLTDHSPQARQQFVVPHNIHPQTHSNLETTHPELQQHFQNLQNARSLGQYSQQLQALRNSQAFREHPHFGQLNLDHVSGNFQQHIADGRYTPGSLNHLNTALVGGNRIDLGRQFAMHQQGDVARRLNLSNNLLQNGGWARRPVGPVYAGYTHTAFSNWYCGPGHFPAYCWTPRWSPWVRWAWWLNPLAIYDPRPFYCRPIIYPIATNYVPYNYPTWQTLPVTSCGTWVDAPQVNVAANAIDVQLLAVRFVDNGQPEQNFGPRYRVWVRNNSAVPVTQPFQVTLVASNTPASGPDLPWAGVMVPSIDAGAVVPVDIRLPLNVQRMYQAPDGHNVPFEYLHVLVDSAQQLGDVDPTNNGTVIARREVLPVDPAAFTTDAASAAPGAVVTIAGEGFGPEPGQVLVSINGQPRQAVIYGWYDLGVQFEMPPDAPVGDNAVAEVIIVRGDGAAANPLSVPLTALPNGPGLGSPVPPAPLP